MKERKKVTNLYFDEKRSLRYSFIFLFKIAVSLHGTKVPRFRVQLSSHDCLWPQDP